MERMQRIAHGVLGVASVGITCALLLRFGGTPAIAAASKRDNPCHDPWISQAYREVTGRAPNGAGVSGDCNPKNYGGGQWSSYQDLLNKTVVRLTGKGVAYAFIAPKMAVLQGHIGWGYILDNGTYAIGATDAPNAQWSKGNVPGTLPKGKDTNTPWRDYAATEAEMLTRFKSHYSPSDTYKEYKRTYVANRNAGAAEGKTLEIRNIGYGLVTNNCLDHTYAVLEAYSVDKNNVMQWKQTHPAPNSWFRAFGFMDLNGTTHKVDDHIGTAL